MVSITEADYVEFMKYKRDKEQGRILTPEGIRLIIEANNFDAEAIGDEFLSMMPKILEWTRR